MIAASSSVLFILALGVATFIAVSARRQCVDVLCRASAGRPADEAAEAARLLAADGQTINECRACQQCTDNGYSVCTMPKRYDRNLRKFLWSRGCECAHAVPRGCEVVAPQRGDPTAKLNAAEGRQLYQICYFSKIRMPAGLHAINTREMVMVTLEPFWLDDYWHGLRPANLTLHYEFVVQDFRHCHGKLTPLSSTDADQLLDGDEHASWDRARNASAATTAAGPWVEPFLCGSSLRIEMHDYSGRSEDGDRSYDDNNNYDYGGENNDKKLSANALKTQIANATDVEPDEIYGDDYTGSDDFYHDDFQPPSVKFERAIFVDARRVRFFYKFDVRRPRQLFMHEFEKKRVVALGSKRTSVTSELTIFELQPEIFGYGDLNTTTSMMNETIQSTTTGLDTTLYTHYPSLTSFLTTAFGSTIPTTDNTTASAGTTTSSPTVDTSVRWRFFRNVFLPSMLASAVVLLMLVYVCRLQHRMCGYFCLGGGAEEKAVAASENEDRLSSQKRSKKKRIFRGSSYQST